MRNVHNIYQKFKWAYLSDKKPYLEFYFKAIIRNPCKDKSIYIKSGVG